VTDPMTSEKPNRVSHVAYGYATQVVILGDDGRVRKVVAAHDVGKAINPNGVEGRLKAAS
jgi:aldehyde oxidoreductase